MNFWMRLMVDRIILVISRMRTQERQLELLQDLDFFIHKLQREIKLNGALDGADKRIKR